MKPNSSTRQILVWYLSSLALLLYTFIHQVDLLPVIKQIQIAHFYSAKVWNRKTIDLIHINTSWKSTIDYWRWQKVYCKKEWRNKEQAIKLSQSILVLYEIRIKNQLQIGWVPIAKPYGSSCNMSFGAGDVNLICTTMRQLNLICMFSIMETLWNRRSFSLQKRMNPLGKLDTDLSGCFKKKNRIVDFYWKWWTNIETQLCLFSNDVTTLSDYWFAF